MSTNDPGSSRPLDPGKVFRQAVEGMAPQPGPQGPTLEELAPRFPQFELLERIGRGGMGTVYKARDRKLDRLVALKVLASELASDPSFEERFLREARALASLNHAHILTVHDFGESDGLFYLVTEFVDGLDLRRLLDMGALSPMEALRISPQVCDALHYAHEHGVVHRDIKPENILVDATGNVRIADFGLAKLLGDAAGNPTLTRSTQVLGTPQYMAPEQWRGGAAVDHRADIFSLGVVLYEMLTGQLPMGHFDPPSDRKGVPTGLDEVVRRSLAQRPDQRYQNVADVQRDLERESRGLQASPNRAPTRRPAAGSRLCKRPIVALVFAALAALTLPLGAFLSQESWRREYRHANDLRQYEAASAARDEALKAGREWTGPIPEMPPAFEEAWYTPVVLWPVVAGLILLGLIFVMVSGFKAIRRIRESEGRLYGMGLAVFTAWLVPLGAANALLLAPLSQVRSSTALGLAMTLGLMICVAGDVVFLVWQTRRQLAAGEAARRDARPAA